MIDFLRRMITSDSRPVHRIHGGVTTLPHRKSLSNQTSVRVAPIPNYIVIPLHQHIGKPAECFVNVGDRVLKGQRIGRAIEFISAPIHAPTSGRVIAIGNRPVPSHYGELGKAIVIETDGLDEWVETPHPQDYRTLSAAELQEKIRLAGIVGLGGAAFPSHAKMSIDRPVDMLIINGAECEPYITCDDMLMRDRPQEIIGGIEIMMHGLNTSQCIIAIEDNKPEAISIIRRAIEQLGVGHRIEVRVAPTVYPTGSEKQLLEILTGKQVPSGGLPIDIGYVVHNVGTAVATYEAIIHSRPVISRLITVTGRGVKQPGNVEVLLGTSVHEVIQFCGGYSDDFERLVAGGPMMGMALDNDEVPLVKRINCLLVGARGELAPMQESLPCIRCGACAKACPMTLLPQQMFWYCKAQNFSAAERHHLFDCIECGCCSYVCPSKIPLVQSFQYGKFQIRTQREDTHKSEMARIRSARKAERNEQANREAAERKAKALAQAQAAKAAKETVEIGAKAGADVAASTANGAGASGELATSTTSAAGAPAATGATPSTDHSQD